MYNIIYLIAEAILRKIGGTKGDEIIIVANCSNEMRCNVRPCIREYGKFEITEKMATMKSRGK